MSVFKIIGWVTKYGVLCSDGSIIEKNAFKSCHIRKVPILRDLINPFDYKNVIGNATLFNTDEGVVATGIIFYENANVIDEIKSGERKFLCAYADHIKMSPIESYEETRGKKKLVTEGIIRCFSIEETGANPEAKLIGFEEN